LWIGNLRTRLPVAAKTAFADRRCDGRSAGLPGATHASPRIDDGNLDLGRLVHAQDLVVVEIALLYRPFSKLISPYSAAVRP
jgi:hypothetical protein